MLFSKSLSSLKVIMKNSYGELNRLTSSENFSLGTKSSPSSSQGTSPVIVRNEGFTNCQPERFPSMCFHNKGPAQVSLEANKVFLMIFDQNSLVGLREFCQEDDDS